MALLINNTSGIAANDNTVNLPVYNPDPVFVEQNLLTTIYVWAANWGGAQVQIFISPQCQNSSIAPVWYPVGNPMSANGFFTFQHRWGQIQAVVTNATANTSGLYTTVFGVL